MFVISMLGGYAQQARKQSVIRLAGLEMPLIDRLPLQLCYINLSDERRLNYLLRAGYLHDTRDIETADGNKWQYASGAAFTLKQSCDAAYLKPGLNLWMRKYAATRHLFNINGCLSYSSNQLSYGRQDPLYGHISETYNETHLHYGVETEYLFMIGLLKERVSAQAGLLLGYKINRTALFKAELPGFGSRDTYDPGMGYGGDVYINLSLGISMKL